MFCNFIDCFNIDYADVHDITYRNINVEYDEVIPQGIYQYKDNEKYEDLVTDYDSVPSLISADVSYHFEYSAGGKRRGKNRNFTFKNINLYGDKPLKMRFAGFDAEHKTENVILDGIYLNGEAVRSISPENLVIKDFTESIAFVDGEKIV